MNGKKLVVPSSILFILLLVSSHILIIGTISGGYRNEDVNESQEPLPFTDVKKYIGGIEQTSWTGESDLLTDNGDTDDTPFEFQPNNWIRTTKADHATCTGTEDVEIDGTTITTTLNDVDAQYVRYSFWREHGRAHIWIHHNDDHLDAIEKQSITRIEIDYTITIEESGSFPPAGGLLDSEDLSIQFFTDQNVDHYHHISMDLHEQEVFSGSIVLNSGPLFDSIKNNGDFIKTTDVECHIYSGIWGHDIAVKIDQLKFNYMVDSDFELDLQYDLSVPDYELSHITYLFVKFDFDSGTDCNVYILDQSDTKHFLASYENTGTVVSFSVSSPEDYILGTSGDPYISLRFEVDQVYVPDLSARQIKVDYIGFDFVENQNPTIDSITLEVDSYEVTPISYVYYLSDVPSVIVEASDGSGILDPNGVTLTDTIPYVHVLDLTGNPDEFIVEPVVGDAWDDYFQTLSEGTYSWMITAQDIHSNPESISIEIVKDITPPGITWDTLPEYSDETPPDIEVSIDEDNLDEASLTIISQEANTWDLIWDGSFYTLSGADQTAYEQAWADANEGSISFQVDASDKAGLSETESFFITKDISDPTIDILYPTDGEEIKFTPDVSAYVLDDTIDINAVTMTADDGTNPSEVFSMELESMTNEFKINSELGDYGLWNDYFGNTPIGPIELTVYAEDLLGHSSTETITIQKIDNTAPTITLLSNDDLWHADPVMVSASADDYNLDEIWYQINEDETHYPIDTEIPQAIWDGLDDGINVIHVYAIDTADNLAHEQYDVKIDREAPVIESVMPDDMSVWNQPPLITADVSDIQPDDDLTLYYEHDGDQYPMENHVGVLLSQSVWDLYLSGEYISITIVAEDSLGFTDQISLNILVDVFPPVISLNTFNNTHFDESVPIIDYSSNEPVDLEIYYEDQLIDFDAWWVTAEYGSYFFKLSFIDAGGNIVNRYLTLYKDDTIDPMLTINYPNSGDEVGEVPPMISIDASDLTLDGITYVIIGQTFNVYFDPGQTSVNLVFSPDEAIWYDAYNQTVEITIFAADSYGNSVNASIILIRSDWAGAHKNDGLGPGLFYDMPVPMIIILMSLLFGTMGVMHIVSRKGRKL